MILVQMAFTCFNLSSFQATWAHFKLDFLIVSPNWFSFLVLLLALAVVLVLNPRDLGLI